MYWINEFFQENFFFFFFFFFQKDWYEQICKPKITNLNASSLDSIQELIYMLKLLNTYISYESKYALCLKKEKKNLT